MRRSHSPTPQHPRPGYRASLFRKYVIIFAALVSGVLLASGLLETYFFYRENRAVLVRVQREQAAGAAFRIAQFVTDIERQIGATLPPPGAGPALLDERADAFSRLLHQVPAITDISYIGPSGQEQLRFSRFSPNVVGSGTDRSREAAFREAKSRKTYISPVYFRYEYEPYATIAVAERSRGGGATVADVNLRFILDVISRLKIGGRGYAYVVDNQGHLLAHPDVTLVLQRTDLSALPYVRSALQSPPSLSDDTSPGAIVRNWLGRRVLSVYQMVEPMGWLVFVEEPLEQVFAPLYASLLRTAALLLAGLGISIVASLVLARRMVTPILALQAGAARIASGDLDVRIPPTSDDELGMLAESFTRMAGSLKEKQAALGQKLVETRALYEVGREISAQVSPAPIFQLVVDRARTLLEAEISFLALQEEGNETFAVRAHSGRLTEEIASLRFRPGEGLGGRVVATQRPIVVDDYLAEFATSPFVQMVRAANLRAHIAVPLKVHGTVIGVLYVAREVPGAFSDEDLQLMSALADHTAIAIERAQLYEDVKRYAEELEAKVEARTRELREANRQLEEASRHKSQFLANMGHELRTPLNVILGYTELILDGIYGPIPENIQEVLRRVQSGGRHLLSLINDVLDLSKIEAGELGLSFNDYAMPEVVQRVLAAVEPLAAEKRLSLKVFVPPDLPAGRGDERRIAQVLLNLLGNAIKFTEAGEVRVEVRASNEEFLVAVTDTGPGITESDRQNIFEEFYQVDSSSTRAKGGTGLGLSIARRIVQLQGGRIGVESTPGQGSTFWFTLPVRVERSVMADG